MTFKRRDLFAKNTLAQYFNPLKAELNPICHLLALLRGATIVVVSRLRVKLLMDTKIITVKIQSHYKH